MPKQFAPGFKRDVVEVARSSGLTRAEVAHDFVVSENTAQRWIRQADIDHGVVDGVSTVDQAELLALRRRARVLEQEVEILRRATAYFAKEAAPE